MSLRPVAVIDSGLASALANVAMDRRELALRAKGEGGDLLRFHRSHPAASIGRDQALDRELRQDFCSRHGIDIVRRPTSGGALYLDSGQLGFSLVIAMTQTLRQQTLTGLLERGCKAIAAGLQQLGIDAAAKAPNDVEIGGRKIASLYATRLDGALLLHGSVLLSIDIDTMLRVLRTPTEKLSPDGLSAARERLIAISELGTSPLPLNNLQTALTVNIATAFGLQPWGKSESAMRASADRIAAERALTRRIAWDSGGKGKVEALVRTRGGTLRARAALTPIGSGLRDIEFAVDAQLEPAGFLGALAQALEGVTVARIDASIAEFISRQPLDAVGFGSAEIGQLLRQLAAKCHFHERSGLNAAGINALMCTNGNETDYAALLGKAGVMLVPYCAKPAWCDWRHRDGCDECGECEVGTAYALARERKMRVVSITNYEHLVATLAEMKANGTVAYVGMCCSHFFIKRYRAFAEVGIPALLMDISGANCYELQQEEQAYAGTFEAESRLDTPLLEQVMKFVPPRTA